jgi:alpha/beta hydrolase fold
VKALCRLSCWQHFRGNLDNWDSALVDALAADRRVVAFDNVGVGATTGRTPSTVEAMAHDAIAFLDAMDLQKVDLLGFSLGSFVAQEIALIRPDLLRRGTTWQTRQAHYDAVCAWGIPDHALLQRLDGIDLPVFVTNGDSDPMILPRYSHLLAASSRTRGSRSTRTPPTASSFNTTPSSPPT